MDIARLQAEKSRFQGRENKVAIGLVNDHDIQKWTFDV